MPSLITMTTTDLSSHLDMLVLNQLLQYFVIPILIFITDEVQYPLLFAHYEL